MNTFSGSCLIVIVRVCACACVPYQVLVLDVLCTLILLQATYGQAISIHRTIPSGDPVMLVRLQINQRSNIAKKAFTNTKVSKGNYIGIYLLCIYIYTIYIYVCFGFFRPLDSWCFLVFIFSDRDSLVRHTVGNALFRSSQRSR